MRSLKIYLVLLLIVLVGIFSLSGCKNIFLSDITDKDDTGSENCQYPLCPATGNVGDTIRSCHFEVTLHQAEYIDIEYRGPRIKLYTTIKLVKSNGKSASIFTDCFTIKDSGGKEYAWDGLGDNDQIPQVTLAEGQKVSGTTTVQVAKDASGFTAIFQESKMGDPVGYGDEIKWKLGF